ncbi:MAG TPA: cupredoxin domain-containing protein [Chloroflexota bacterium]
MQRSIRSLILVPAISATLIAAAILPSGRASAQTSQVAIVNFSYQPTPLNVPAGTTVMWTNQDSVAHTVTADNGSFNSSALNNGQSYSFTFTQAGTFTYHCAIHSYMQGTITVTGAAQPTATPTSPGQQPTATIPPVPTNTPQGAPPATNTPTAIPTATPVPTATSKPSAKGKTKTIRTTKSSSRYVYNPKNTTITVGTTVTWSNVSDAWHTVTSTTKGWKFNKTLKTGKRLTFVFKKVGTYHYHCTFHPGMVGKIIVKKR